jgi:hypothetical protein
VASATVNSSGKVLVKAHLAGPFTIHELVSWQPGKLLAGNSLECFL